MPTPTPTLATTLATARPRQGRARLRRSKATRKRGTPEHEPSAGRGLSRHLRSRHQRRSEEHTSELQSLMRISYAVFCLKKKKGEKHRYVLDNKSTTESLKHDENTNNITTHDTNMMTT